jgi:hypothetical protein
MEVFVLISKKMGHIRLNESSHRQTSKVKILVALGLRRGRYSIFQGIFPTRPSFLAESYFRIST